LAAQPAKHPDTGVWIVIPAYNEAGAIARVIAGLRPLGHRVLVVDDGSRDATAALAAEAGADVVHHPINLGQGAALQTGLDYALLNGARVIVTFDADGQHRPQDVPRLVEALAAQGVDYALGSRFLGGTTNMPASRRLLLRAATLFTRLTTRLSLTDAHNGLRAMTKRGAANIRLRQNRMAHASELLAQIAESGLPYTEVPVTIEYTRYSLAKGQKTSDSIAILVDLFARRLYQ
jgi:glycosyltransferase involved in cell wall biosynthesis